MGKTTQGSPAVPAAGARHDTSEALRLLPQSRPTIVLLAKRYPHVPLLFTWPFSNSTSYTGASDRQSPDCMPAFYTRMGRWGNKYILASTLGSTSPKYKEFSKHWKLFRWNGVVRTHGRSPLHTGMSRTIAVNFTYSTCLGFRWFLFSSTLWTEEPEKTSQQYI